MTSGWDERPERDGDGSGKKGVTSFNIFMGVESLCGITTRERSKTTLLTVTTYWQTGHKVQDGILIPMSNEFTDNFTVTECDNRWK